MMKTEPRKIAIIGTAGRDKGINLQESHWNFMTQTIYEEVTKEDILISGGAAWADHVAVWAFMNGLCKELHLHLPAPFSNGGFDGDYGTSGGAANYYHKLFSKNLGFWSLGHIEECFKAGNCFITHQPTAKGYAAMVARNKLVATQCTHMVAFTLGDGAIPQDGGTKITWDMAGNKERAHISISGK